MPDRPTRIPERFPLVMDPPFRLDRARTFLFALECDPDRLDALLARTFGWAAPDIEIERLGKHCLLVLTDVAQATAGDPSLGWFAYKEATIFVPVWGRRGGVPFVAMHVPFIYPDDGLAIAAGREIYGLPKKPASIAMPSAADLFAGVAPVTTTVRAAERFDGSEWVDRTLFTITTAGTASTSSAARTEVVTGATPANRSAALGIAIDAGFVGSP